MTHLFELIQKFKKGTASESEKKTLLEALSLNEQELMVRLETEYEENVLNETTILSRERSAEIFTQIQQRKASGLVISANSQNKLIQLPGNWLRWIAAACIIGLMTIGISNLKRYGTHTSTNIATSVEQQIKQLSNTGNKIMMVHLLDGSTVSIAPNSTISYYQPFGNKRDISLTGEATFVVAKDAAKPFTVYAGGITTTALGTEFSVNAFDDKVEVRLLEGKVVVRSVKATIAMNDTYLKPGEQILVNELTGKYAVSTYNLSHKTQTNSNAYSKMSDSKQRTKIIDALIFNKTSLVDVFTKVSNQYNMLIQYNKDELRNLSFTGSFLPTDSLQTILTIICGTNDLSFKQDKGIIVITK